MKSNTGVLLVNLGSPDKPRFNAVYKYLTEFLNDPRVIDLPWHLRKFLVNGIIVPFRCAASTKAYQKLWTDKGSPLIHWSRIQQQKLQYTLDDRAQVYLAMRYQNPSLTNTLEQIRKDGITHLHIIPLFPQYASATSGSVIDECMRIMRKWWVVPELHVVSDYYDHPDYIRAIVNRTSNLDLNSYDHILFSYHGLPMRQLDKVYKQGVCDDHDCTTEINETNSKCYMAQCYATSRALARELHINPSKYTVCFQSRLDKKWTEPFADKTIIRLAQQGARNILVFSPAFVADCLETTIEIGEEYLELFREHGGESLDLVPGINDEQAFIACLADLTA
ncbi:MAG: ferrochelatase [Flavobacteriales bacterium]|nr:ferrochelatase [Flavobacteriales bacterium]